MISGDLDEYRLRELLSAGAPIDAFGVGTELATSADAPSMPAVYKLVELESGGARRFTAKFSADKVTMPAAKQVWRGPDGDLVTRLDEPGPPGAAPLLRPLLREGKLVEPLPDARAARAFAAARLAEIPAGVRQLENAEPYPVRYSASLEALLQQARSAI
jgi:nicotinate phosphoribosyltransferase